MERFYGLILRHPKRIITIFAVVFVACIIARPFISVNYDMNDYLPDTSPSTVAIDKVEEEYDGGIPNARVMLKDVSIPQALDYKEKIAEIDGVTDVTWLDDVYDVTKPLEASDIDIESYYKDENALLTVTVSEDKRIEAVEGIRNVIGDDNAMMGSSVSTATATTSTVNEIKQIAVIGVLFALFILLITTSSWAEPFIVLGGLGVAVVINAGSNIIFGEISFVTNAAGNILQLAVSLDYSVFLIHRFTECRREEPNVRKAMLNALSLSTSSILSSGATTVIGFLALCLMRFQIGPDLGLALAKGILISLITVFILMPIIILYTYKLIDMTMHKPILPSFRKFGKFILRVMVPIVCVFAIAIVPSYIASNSNSFYYGASHIFNEKTQLGKDIKEINAVFGENDTYVLMVPKDDLAKQKKLSEELKNIEKVDNITSYVDSVGVEIPKEYIDESTLKKLDSDEDTRMVIAVNADYEGDETFALVENIRETAQKYYGDEYYLAGEGVSTYDLMDTVTKDMLKVNLIAIGAVLLVLLITMRKVFLPAILVLAIETAIWINLSMPCITGHTIFYIAYLIISSVQLGATVDYAILFSTRYREERATLGKKEAIVETISKTTASILTSGTVLTVVGFLLGVISSHGLLSQLGYLLGIGTLCSLMIVLFVLPGLLYIFDKWVIDKKLIGGNR